MTNQTATFTPGTTYKMLWAGNADALTLCRCINRTAKFVSFDVDGYMSVRVAIRMTDDGESALPMGSYSMAPCVKAKRVA